MYDDARPAGLGLSTASASHLVHAVLHFLRAVQRRWALVAGATIVALALGAVYYLTATPLYEAKTQILLLQSGRGVLSAEMASDSQGLNLIPTYEKLFTSHVVLERACQTLAQMPPAARIDLDGAPRDQWPRMLANRIVAKGVRNTNVIELSFRSKDPRAGEVVVGAIKDAYLAFMDENHKSVAQEILDLLQGERLRVEERLQQREAELRDTQLRLRTMGLTGQEKSNIVHPIVQRAIKANDALYAVQEKRLQLQAGMRALEAAKKNGGDLRQHLAAVAPHVGEQLMLTSLGMNVEDTRILADLDKQLVEYRQQLSTLREHLGPAHSRVVALQRKIANLERDLAGYYSGTINPRLNAMKDGELAPLITRMVQGELERLMVQEAEMTRMYRQAEAEAVALSDSVAALETIQRDITLQQNMHDSLVSRIATIELREDSGAIRVEVISAPRAEDTPVSPKLTLVGLVCLLLGVGGGGAIVYVLDVLDDRFRTPEELKAEVGSPLLAMVRQMQSTLDVGVDSLRAYAAPNSPDCEAFRTLRTALSFAGRDLDRVAVTSAEPSDGKTTVLANLGASYAMAGKRTLLIDADLRRPGLSKLFQMRGYSGVSEILRSEEDAAAMCAERVRSTELETLDVLPCGPKPVDPAELLSGDRLAEVLAWAESNYDQVLIDCPPVLAAADAALVGRSVDGVVLVVQPEKNHRRLVLRAAESLRSLEVNLVGLVANKIGAESGGAYDTYGYGYGYHEQDDEAETRLHDDGLHYEDRHEYDDAVDDDALDDDAVGDTADDAYSVGGNDYRRREDLDDDDYTHSLSDDSEYSAGDSHAAAAELPEQADDQDARDYSADDASPEPGVRARRRDPLDRSTTGQSPKDRRRRRAA